MDDEAMKGEPDLLTATGFIEGPVNLITDELQWPPVTLRKKGEQVHFDASMVVTGRDEDEILDLKSRIGPAVEAAVVASCGAATRAEVTEWSYPNGPLTRREGVGLGFRFNVLVGIDRTPEDVRHGEAVLRAVLLGNDKRLAELYKVYRLGVEGVQTIAPVVGLWAFTVILEEESRSSTPNLDHVLKLAAIIGAAGFDVPSEAPERHPARIRAAALHPTRKDAAPSPGEVRWFRELAGAYLRWRAAGRP
jgi:hypothetical protein